MSRRMSRGLLLGLLLLPGLACGQVTNQQALSQVGATLVRTAAEVTAGVTPTNYGYAPLNALRYGADSTGVADATTAINNAVAVAAVNCGVVVVPQGTYLTSAAINVKACVTLNGYGATINYNGTGFAFSTGATGTTNYPSIFGFFIKLNSGSAGALQLNSLYQGHFRDLYITDTVNGSTNIIIKLGTNTTGTVNPTGNLNNQFNIFDTITIDATQYGTGMQLLGSTYIVTDNTFHNLTFEGAAAGGAAVYGIEFNQNCDTNIFSGFTLIALARSSPANGIGVGFGTGAGGGVFAEVFEELAVDVFGSPATDNRQGFIANNTTVKYIVMDQFEYGPIQGLGAFPSVAQMLSSTINDAPRGTTNYQSIAMVGSNLGVGILPTTNDTIVVQNVGQSVGATQYNVFSGTVGFNSGSPVLAVGYGSQPSLTSSASPYTVTQVMGYQAAAAALGSNATATNVYSYYDAGQTVGSTANYGYYSAAANPTWAFYGSGTGPSFFGGGVEVGVPTGGNEGVGTINIANGLAGLFLNGTAIQATSPTWTGNSTFAPASGVPVSITAPSGQNAVVITPASGTNSITAVAGAGAAAQINLRGNGNSGANGLLVNQDGSGNGNINAQAGNLTLNSQAGSLQLQHAGANKLSIGTTGSIVNTSTTFTVASGTGACATTSALHGGGQVGDLQCTGSTGASTVTLTLPASTTGYFCGGRDVTTPTTVTQTGAISTSSVTLTLTSVTTNDVIQFGCGLGY